MTRYLVISPQAGLGNRLRALSSAIVLARQTGRRLLHAWTPPPTSVSTRRTLERGGSLLLGEPQSGEERDESLLLERAKSKAPVSPTPLDSRANVRALQMLRLEDLLTSDALRPATDITAIDVCFSEWLPDDGWYDVQSSAQRRWFVQPTPTRDDPSALVAASEAPVVLVETSLAFRLEASDGGLDEVAWEHERTRAYATLEPSTRFARLLADTPTCSVGVSIRRGDLLRYFPSAAQDEGALTRWMIDLAHRYPVALFSDDSSFRLRIVATARSHGGQIVDPFPPDLRARLAPWELGFLEFLYLSRCPVVTGTPHSSFAREAALFGGCR